MEGRLQLLCAALCWYRYRLLQFAGDQKLETAGEAAAIIRLAVPSQDLQMRRLLGGSALDHLRGALARME